MPQVKFIFLTIVWIVLCTAQGKSQPEYPLYRKADKQFDLGQYQDAETDYRKAAELKSKPETAYNLGNTIYEQNRLPEAITQYQKAIVNTSDPVLKSNAYYNMGNAHFQNKEYDDAVKNYKEALKLQPEDEEAKKNLMLAMRQLQQQQQQQQQNQDQQKKKKDDNKEKQNQDQQQPQQDNQENKDKQEQQQQQQSPNQDPKNQQQQDSKQDVSKDEAKEILKAVEREDQRVQEKLKKVTGTKAPPVKDW